jgi:transposase
MSHTSGVVATKLIDKLIDGKQITIEDIDSVYHHRLHASREELLEACNGYVTEHHVFMLRTIRDDIAATEAVISKIDKRIKNMLAPYDNVIELLKKVPGLNTKTIEDLVAEIGLDMSVFPNEKHLCSWVGIAPGNNTSTGSVTVRVLAKKKWAYNPWQQAG